MNNIIPNSTQIPNLILDLLLPELNDAETKCLLYVCRRTFGFHKNEDKISLSQFVDGIKSRDGNVLDKGTGMSRPSVVSALKILTNSGLIFIRRKGQKIYYSINLDLSTDELVKKFNWLKNLTRTSKKIKPVQVKLFNQNRLKNLTHKRKETKERINADKNFVIVDNSQRMRLAEIKKPLLDKMSLNKN